MTNNHEERQADQEVLAADSPADVSQRDLEGEYSQAVMKRLVDLGYMDAGLDI